MMGCVTSAARPTPASTRPEAVAHRARVVEASLAVRRAARARDAAVRRLRSAPSAACAPVARAHRALNTAWQQLDAAWASTPALNPTPEVATARAQAAVQAGLDTQSDAAWARWCAARAPVGPVLSPPAVRGQRCGPLRVRGAAVGVAGAQPLANARDTVALLQAVSAQLNDTWDLIFVVETPALDRAQALAAHVAVHRAVPGLGPAPVHPRHLPRWRALEGAVVLSAAEGWTDGPALREIVRVYGNRWVWPGCSPGPGDGWGLSDAGGQLGGGRSGSLRALGNGRYHLDGLGLGRPAQLANGGNTAPYADLELYLLGLKPLGAVRPVVVLRDGRQIGRALTASGLCRLTPATIDARFGQRPLRSAPWRVGLIVRGRQLPSAATLDHWRARLWAFATPGPDDNPLRLSFWEATAGLGTLLPTPATLRDGCDAPSPRLP